MKDFSAFFLFKCLLEKDKKLSLQLPNEQTNFLILNSLSFLEKRREQLEKYERIHLFLDRDKAGLQATQRALNWSTKYTDQSLCYKHSKDLNEHLIKQHQQQQFRRSHRYRMNF